MIGSSPGWLGDSPWFHCFSETLPSSGNVAPWLSFQSWAGPPREAVHLCRNRGRQCVLQTFHIPKTGAPFPKKTLFQAI